MFSILTSGLSLEGKELLQEALTLAYGEGSAEIIELNKDNLRQQVRLSVRTVSTTLVILDAVSMDECKDIENGLYNSDKFHQFKDEVSLVDFLNGKFGIELSFQPSLMDLSGEVVSEGTQEVIERYENQIEDKNQLINHLKARVEELNRVIEEGDYTEADDSGANEELESARQENLDLRSKLSSLGSEMKVTTDELIELKKERDDLKILIEKLELKRDSVLADLNSVGVELADYKLKYSTQSGLLRSVESELDSLKGNLSSLEDKDALIETLKYEKFGVEKELTSKSTENIKLTADLLSVETELARLKQENTLAELGDAERESLKEEISSLSAEKLQLIKDLADLKDSLATSESTLLELQSRIDNLTKEKLETESIIVDLKGKLSSSDESLMQLNHEKIEMQSRLAMLERSTSRDTDIEGIMSEIAELRQKYDSLSSSIFSRIASMSMPKSSSKVSVLRHGVKVSKVVFMFSGSTESRRGTYKCLLNELKSLPKTEKYLLVDVVSETAIDYVFEIGKVEKGIDWFRKGGGVQPYLSKTCLPNVSVLSPGLDYVNDSYFLTVDWHERLTELEESGYNVILYCGDISNIVGRVLHESFAGLSESKIFVHGNAVGSRTILCNLRGLSNSSNSTICYFEYNNQMDRFLNIVQKTNKCEILSTS